MKSSKKPMEWRRIIECDEVFVGWIDLCNMTMFRLTSFITEKPKFSLFVALEGRGNFFFAFNEQEKHPNYVSEKLSIPIADAEPLADWINTQMGTYKKQYGEYLYTDNMIDKHANLLERQTQVLHPYYKEEK